MEETVRPLVVMLLDSVKEQTKTKYPDVNEVLTSLQVYVQDSKFTILGLSEKLENLDDVLSRKNEKKKQIQDYFKQIKEAMRVHGKTTPGGREKSKHSSWKRSTSAKKGNTTSPKVTTAEPKRSEVTQTDVELLESNDHHAEEEDIIQLKVENQYLRKTLDRLHKNLINGDETLLKELKTPKNMKNAKLIVEVEAIIKEVKQKVHKMETEASYASSLLEELNQHSTNDSRQDTQTILTQPPTLLASDRSNSRSRNNKKQKEQTQRSRDVEQLQRNFENASNILKKQIDMEDAITERECLLLTLEGLSNHVRDIFEGRTDSEVPSTFDQIKSSVKKESSANQGLTHAREILNIQAEWKRESEYASHLLEELKNLSTHDGKQECQITLRLPPIQMTSNSSKDGKKNTNKQNDELSRPRHVEQMLKAFENASFVSKKQMDAQSHVEEKQLLESILDDLFSDIQKFVDSDTSEKTKSVLDEKRKSIDKDKQRSTYMRLQKAKNIYEIQVELKREAQYAARLLDKLSKLSQTTKDDRDINILSAPPTGTTQSINEAERYIAQDLEVEPQQTQNNKRRRGHFAKASAILNELKEKHKLLLEKTRLEDEQKNHQAVVDAYVSDIKNSQKRILGLREDIERQNKQSDERVRQLQRLNMENRELKKDIDQLRTRLSEIAAAKLTHENPSIADLSDPNRPTKLAEQYSELYDDQWTNAFSTLSNYYPGASDEKITGYLYEILIDGYRFCESVRMTQKKSIEVLMLHPDVAMESNLKIQAYTVNEIFLKLLNDAAKVISNVTSANMVKAFVENDVMKKKYGKLMMPCKTFIERSVTLCWHMQVQTPPVCIDHKTAKDQAFRKEVYREYTSKGVYVAFVVWPALFLHEGGPLLVKGVAQGDGQVHKTLTKANK